MSDTLSTLLRRFFSWRKTMQAELSHPTTLVHRLTSLSLPSPTLQENRALYILIFTAFAVLLLVRYTQSPLRKLPPGPRGLPIIGNLLQLGGKQQWLTFTEWRNTYGDLVYLNVAGLRLIVINSHKVAGDLLERRAAKSSDRPRNIVAAEILTGGLLFVFTRYSDVWRRMRKAAHGGLNKSVAHRYHPTQTTEAILLAASVLAQPKEWFKHIRRNAASSIMSIVYDTPPIASEKDESVKKVNDFVARLARAGMPGAYLVEFFPWMMYIPRSLAKWRREAEEWHIRDSKMFISLFNSVRDRMAEGEDRPSLTATLIEDAGRHNLSENENAWVAATMYAAGSETTSGVMAWWMLAMVLYPETQKRAQAELDAVVGRSRLPSFADAPHLPYIQAMVKECLRWRPVDPLGMPHYTTEDDWYDGVFIPKNTVILPNVWHLNRDPEVYGADAAHFNPARHLDEDGRVGQGPADAKEEGHFTYGFGRRVCVGRHVSNNSLFINIAMTLWTMTIERATDDKGDVLPMDVDGCVEDGLVVRPVPFECKVTPRFPEAVAILEEERERLAHGITS